jgi:hypothetical protein
MGLHGDKLQQLAVPEWGFNHHQFYIFVRYANNDV